MIKKAQNGTPSAYMVKRAAQDKVKAKNIRARDSVLNRDAAARGMTREEQQKFLAKNAKKADQQLEGTYTAKDTKEANKKEGLGILSRVASAVSKPHCIFSDENKSGCKSGESAGHKNGGTIKKAQTGDTISKKTVAGPKSLLKTYTTKSGDKKVTGYIAKTKDWERSSRTLKNPSAKDNDTIYSKRERGGGKDIKGVTRSAEMHDYKVKRPGGVEKGSSYTTTQGGKTTQVTPTKKTFKATKNKNGGRLTSKKK